MQKERMNIVNEQHFAFWTPEDRNTLDQASTFGDLAALALTIMRRMPLHIQMVSGPISTGGMGNITDNCKVFQTVIEMLASSGLANLSTFSQMPFEEHMARLAGAWKKTHPGQPYCTPILTEFYEPIFSSGLVSILNFIHGWESSVGARWEHENCERWRIVKHYLPPDMSTKTLKRWQVS